MFGTVLEPNMQDIIEGDDIPLGQLLAATLRALAMLLVVALTHRPTTRKRSVRAATDTARSALDWI